MKKRLSICLVALFVCTLVFVQCVSTPAEPEEPTTATPEPESTPGPTKTPEPTPEPTKIPEPSEEPAPEAGELWLELSKKSITTDSLFSTELRLNTGDQKIAAYGIYIHYDSAILNLDAGKGNNGVVTGADGFVAAVNAAQPGKIFIAGFDAIGKGPGTNLHFFTIYWKAVKKGSTTIEIEIDKLTDEFIRPLGVTKGRSVTFTVE